MRWAVCPSVRPLHCGIKSKLITVGSCGFLQLLAPFMSACVNPRVGLQPSRMSRKYTIYLNMSLLGGTWVEIIWHFGGDRVEKGQWRRGRGGDGDSGGEDGMGTKYLPCQSLDAVCPSVRLSVSRTLVVSQN